jgi:uncharacterized protein YbcV (DUF1398 family)
MFTLNQINSIHKNLGKQSTLVEYLKALSKIGVVSQDTFVSDGHSLYFAKDGTSIISLAVHQELLISKVSNKQEMLKFLESHNQDKIDYLEMSKGLAESGIKKWTFDTNKMTITYYALYGREVLVEKIK